MHPLLGANLQAFSLIGLWPLENKSKNVNKLLKIYGMILYLWLAIFTVSQFVEIYFIGRDYKALSSNVGVSLLHTVLLSKIFVMLFRKIHVQKIVDAVDDTEIRLLSSENERGKELFRQYSEQQWFVTKFIWILAFFTILGFFVSPKIESFLEGKIEILISENMTALEYSKILVFSSWVPYDKSVPGYYELTYGIDMCTGIIGALYVAIWDTFAFGLITHGIGQLKILQDQIINIGKNEKTDENSIYTEVKECIKHHQYIIQ